MDIPNLPTDSPYKFLTVGSLALCVACLIGAFMLLDRSAASLSRSAQALLDDPNFARLAQNHPQVFKADEPAPVKVVLKAAEMRTTVDRRTSVFLGLFAFVMYLQFCWSVWAWIRHDRINDYMLALDYADRAKAHGINVELALPKTIQL